MPTKRSTKKRTSTPKRQSGTLKAKDASHHRAVVRKNHHGRTRSLTHELFQKFDEDGSGELEWDEFQGLAALLGEKLSDAQAKDIIKSLDVDKNGTVDFSEFSSWLNGFNGLEKEDDEEEEEEEVVEVVTKIKKKATKKPNKSKKKPKSKSKRSRTRTRTKQTTETIQTARPVENNREVWPVFLFIIRAMVVSWFMFSAYDRLVRPNAWEGYMRYQQSNFLRMGIDLGNNTDSLQIIFWVFSAVEILGALLFLFGFDRWGIELLIAYLFFTGVILHHFWVKKLESSVMNTLAFTQIVTVLGLLLYVRENLLIQQQYSKSSQTVVIAAASMEDEEDDVDVDEEEEEEEDDEEEVTVVKKVTRKKKSMKKTSEQQAALERIRARIDTIDFGTIGTATHDERDDLQRIVGIGPFCEEKLHSLEIFTFRQIAAMTPEIEFNVNEAIEFFNGRIRRDDWIGKARQFVEEGGHD